jgi:squalene synthase HpnC
MMLAMSATPAPFNPANSVQHYENFPVASLLLPRYAVPAVQALYRFARAADDIADEGNAAFNERLQTLQSLAAQLDTPHNASSLLVRDCAPFIANGTLPVQYLQDLLKAFIQDVEQDQNAAKVTADFRHATMDSLLNYCVHSANPVGRLMLHAVGAPCNALTYATSDYICTSLQLINFWQDMAKDAAAGRVYVPQDVFERYGNPSSPTATGYQSMMAELCADARARMMKGTPLLAHLSGRFKAEISLTMAGGLRILDKLAACEYDVAHRRPKLGWRDSFACMRIIWKLYANRCEAPLLA